MSRLLAWLFVLLQHMLPKHLLTALVFQVAGIRSKPVKNCLIRRFVDLYNVDVAEVDLAVPDGFDTFNDFFTRQLDGQARPIDADADTIVSPVDGAVSAAGKIDAGMLFQAKGLRYSLADLLMTDIEDVNIFNDGSFATMYLAPFNYHRMNLIVLTPLARLMSRSCLTTA